MAFLPSFVALATFLKKSDSSAGRPIFLLYAGATFVRGVQAPPAPWPGDGPQAVLWRCVVGMAPPTVGSCFGRC